MRRRAALGPPLLLLLAACSGTAEPTNGSSQAGTSAGGSGVTPAAGTGGAGQAGNASDMTVGGTTSVMSGGGGGGTSLAGGGSDVGGSAGSAGASGASGGGGAAGAAGGAPGGCVMAGTPGKTGQQCDPGTDDDGTHDQVMPLNNLPPEAMGTPEGELSAGKQLQSQVFGYSFNYRTYKPTAYQAGKPAALMIFQDGGNYTGNFKAPRVFDNVIKDGSVPVTISVYIDPTGQRSKEYDTRSNKYGTMLITELLPELAKSFDLVDDPNGWAIGGHSSGGSCAFNVAWQFPDKFHKVMTHSGSFVNLQTPGDADYINLAKTTLPLLPIRVTLLSGTNDLAAPTWFNANNNMSMSLMTAGYHYRYEKSTTEHGPTKWHFNDFPAGLRWLWRGYTLPQYPAK